MSLLIVNRYNTYFQDQSDTTSDSNKRFGTQTRTLLDRSQTSSVFEPEMRVVEPSRSLTVIAMEFYQLLTGVVSWENDLYKHFTHYSLNTLNHSQYNLKSNILLL